MDRLEWVKISSREASEEMFTEAQVMINKGLKKEVSVCKGFIQSENEGQVNSKQI